MLPISADMSSVVSALPAASSTAPSASGQPAPGGFAGMLAAAQDVASQSQGKTSQTPVTTDTAAPSGLSGQKQTLGNPLPKKLTNGNALSSLSAATFSNPAAATSPATAISLAAAQTQISELAPVTVQPVSQTASDSIAPSASLGKSDSASAQPISIANSAPLPVPSGPPQAPLWTTVAPHAASVGTPNSFASGAASVQPTELTRNTQEPALPIQNPPPSAPSITTMQDPVRSNIPENTYGGTAVNNGPPLAAPSLTLLAENSTPAVSNPKNLTASITNGANVNQNGLVNQSAANESAGTSLGPSGTILPAAHVVESAASRPTLLADANQGAAAIAEIVSSAANVTAADSAAQVNLAPGLETGGTPPATSVPIPDPSVLNPLTQLVGSVPAPNAVSKGATGIASSMVREPGKSAGAGASAPATSLATAPGSGNESPAANQTPFSIFFSGPGPGTASAASTLPKMILPATSSAIRSGHASGTEASSANPQAGGNAQNGITQNAARQNVKEAASGTQSGTPQAAQPLHRDGDPSTAVQIAPPPPPPATAPAAALPSPAAVPPPLGGQAGVPAELPPKPDSQPGAPGGSASLVPLPPEQAAMVPGPVQVAQMVSRVGQADMRIGMNTSAFGSVEIRTSVHANDVNLVIGSEKGDLRTLLANEIPAITNTLQQQSVRLNSVNFMQGFAFSNNASGNGNSEQRSFMPMRAAGASLPAESSADESMEARLAARSSGGGSSLSILA